MSTDLSNQARRRRVAETFQQRFGAAPVIWVRAPGCVDLMGGDSDFPGRQALSLAISRDTWIAARPRSDGVIRLYSMNLESATNFLAGINSRNPLLPWGDYVRGVAARVREERLKLGGFDGVIQSTVPIGAGLGSAAALQCAAATVFEELGGWRLDPEKKARLCQEARIQFLGPPGGLLGLFTSCAGQAGAALLIEAHDLSSRRMKLPAGLAVVIGDTRFKHKHADAERRLWHAQCEEGGRRLGVASVGELTPRQFQARAGALPPGVAARCRYVLEESARAEPLARALARFDRRAIRRLTAASFADACALGGFDAPPLRGMREAMLRAPGVVGARLVGVGLGGSLVALVERAPANAFAAFVRQAYFTATGLQPEIHPVQAVAGAGPLRFRR